MSSSNQPQLLTYIDRFPRMFMEFLARTLMPKIRAIEAVEAKAKLYSYGPPYDCTETQTLVLELDGRGYTVDCTGADQTAAEIVAQINAAITGSGYTAAVDLTQNDLAERRFIISADDAIVAGGPPKIIKCLAGSSILGIKAGDLDEEVPIPDIPRFAMHTWHPGLIPGSPFDWRHMPAIYFADRTDTENQAGSERGPHTFNYLVYVEVMAGNNFPVTIKHAQRIARGIAEVIIDDRRIDCEVHSCRSTVNPVQPLADPDRKLVGIRAQVRLTGTYYAP